ncbi:carbamoyltransferase HypF [Synechococcus sp. BDU 130192]|uniref:carbamoyltransferase HypF n=1 Tax=Synechococcus sp. BDU 130192 TaxID=2042059 RepID=UPI000C06E528|nr:carbamoyltransferase HypF [Synechococcus sp. BDU 130192]
MKRRLRLEIQGTVQGVGFRPFVYQLATALNLFGWVNNSAAGVTIEVEGGRSLLNLFLEKLQTELPPHAKIDALKYQYLEPIGFKKFEIHASQTGEKIAIILSDLATCSECIAEIFAPQNRRYQYPFTNCTHCGPRYSIIETLPYDRPLTSMADFPMCADCQREYEDPGDRRFHAQPNACPICGPKLEFLSHCQGQENTNQSPLEAAIQYIRDGKIVALKGLGGFQLLVDARNNKAVQQLRDRKQRPDKPFAVMYPDLPSIKNDCFLPQLEEEFLTSQASPIVLLQKKKEFNLAENVAPHNPNLGVMLPYTPLHHLLLKGLNFPVIATSGNRSDEPICIEETEALERLKNIADGFLIHNRRILRPVDDSVVQVMNNTPIILRRSRGYAPEPLTLKRTLSKSVLAMGAHLKNTVAIAQKNHIFLSQHIGDLSNQLTLQSMEKTLQKLSQIYDFQPDIIACDLHPDYLSTQYAKNLAQKLNISLISVQHHHAHIYACMAEHQLESPLLGVAWDGTGYGEDGTIWGGEFFWVTKQGCEKIAHFKPFPLPGGDQASREPRRSALGLLSQFYDLQVLKKLNLPTIQAFSATELELLLLIFKKDINTPFTSGVGRLFDGVASLLDLRQRESFEGQAAMALEFSIDGLQIPDFYQFQYTKNDSILEIDSHGLFQGIIQDLQNDLPENFIAAKFHNTLVEIIFDIYLHTLKLGFNSRKNIVLTGGCFQNKYLLEKTIQKLESSGANVYYPQKFPPNDGAIALGQIMVVAGQAI